MIAIIQRPPVLARSWRHPHKGCAMGRRGRSGRGILYAEIDATRVASSRRTLDVVGHCARRDIFDLQVRRAPVTPVR